MWLRLIYASYKLVALMKHTRTEHEMLLNIQIILQIGNYRMALHLDVELIHLK